jgi:hypothetical protein
MPPTNLSTLLALEQKIAAARQRLQKLYETHGCSNDVVLAARIELHDIIGTKANHIDSIGITYGSFEELQNENPTHIIDEVEGLIKRLGA